MKALKITTQDIGREFRCRNGDYVRMIGDSGNHRPYLWLLRFLDPDPGSSRHFPCTSRGVAPDCWGANYDLIIRLPKGADMAEQAVVVIDETKNVACMNMDQCHFGQIVRMANSQRAMVVDSDNVIVLDGDSAPQLRNIGSLAPVVPQLNLRLELILKNS